LEVSSDDGVSVDPNVSLEAVASDSDGADGVSPSDDGASEDASSDEDDTSVEGVSVEGVSDSGFDSELELLNIEPIGSNPNIPEDEEEDEEEEEEEEEEDESSVILETLSGLDFFVCDFLFFPFFFLEGFLLHAERQYTLPFFFVTILHG
jgi:hypothetical protein